MILTSRNVVRQARGSCGFYLKGMKTSFKMTVTQVK